MNKNNDKIIRGITSDGYIRFFGVNCLGLVKEAAKMHNFSTTNSVIFGRLAAAALIMGADFKYDKEVLSLKLNSDGIAGGSVVTVKREGDNVFIKGFMQNPEIEIPLDTITKDFDVKTALGKGQLQIIKDSGLKNPYVGNVDLIYKEIAEDITYYYAQSEQIPTSLGLGVLVFPGGEIKQAGGFMVQLLPNTPEEVITKLEENIKKLPNLTDMLDIGHSIKTLITDYILKGFKSKITENLVASYKCDCCKEKFLKGLKLLDKNEIKSILEEQGEVRTTCHFCNKEYVFLEKDFF